MRKVISVRLSDDEIAPLRQLAAQRGVSMSDVLRSLVRFPTVATSGYSQVMTSNGNPGFVTTVYPVTSNTVTYGNGIQQWHTEQ